MNAFVLPVIDPALFASEFTFVLTDTPVHNPRLRAEPETSTTTSAEPADVTVEWVDDDGSTVTHYEGEVSA